MEMIKVQTANLIVNSYYYSNSVDDDDDRRLSYGGHRSLASINFDLFTWRWIVDTDLAVLSVSNESIVNVFWDAMAIDN